MSNRTNSVRPKELFDKVCRQRELDGKSFHSDYHDRFTATPCPACGSEGVDVFKKYGFTFQECPECLTIYCSPRPDDELLKMYYAHYDAPKLWTDILMASNTQRAKKHYAPRVQKIIGALDGHGEGGVAVDLGAGNGTFAQHLAASRYFSNVICLDWCERCVDECLQKGLKSLQGGLELLGDGCAQLICLNDVIEHLFDPGDVLRQCWRVLEKGGYVSIAAPNGRGFDQLVLGKETANVVPPEHLTFFNPAAMRILFKQCGFEVVDISTPGRLDVAIVADEVDKGFALGEGGLFIETIIHSEQSVRDSFQTFLSSHGLSGHMLCIGRKK
ncbi:MAG: methyltransferase domain-containing protein [Pseudomonadota bacterium]